MGRKELEYTFIFRIFSFIEIFLLYNENNGFILFCFFMSFELYENLINYD